MSDALAEPIETIHANGLAKPQRVVELRPHVARKLLQLQGRLEEAKALATSAQERAQLVQGLFNSTLTDALEDGGVTPSPDAQYSIDYRTNVVILETS
jgi:hypothetical protein